jgi:hypothetical protein
VTTRNVGDQVDTRYVVSPNGVLTDATTVLTVTDPAGTITTPSVTHTSTGIYDGSFAISSDGVWFWYWTASGAVVDVTPPESVLAATPGPVTYASLSELKAYLGITDTAEDPQLQDSLITASRSIEHICGRRFWPDQTATARLFQPRDADVVNVDDFWTSTGLVVAVDDSDSGTYSRTLTAADYVLEPFNGVNDGEPGWPYYRLGATNSGWPSRSRRPSVQVTAKWGWAAIPGPIKQACVYLAEETFKMKGSPFGVAATDQFGPIRMRNNPKVMSMLAPYQDSVVMMA